MARDLSDDLVDLKSYLGTTTEAHDGVLLRLVQSAWDYASNLTGQTYNDVKTNTSQFLGGGSAVYTPPVSYRPVVAVTSLIIANQTIPALSGYGSSGYYILDYGDGIGLMGYKFWHRQLCQLVHTYGVLAPPEDLRQAVIELAAIKQQAAQRLGKKSVAGEARDTTTYFDDDVTPSISAVFDRYTVYLP